MAIEIVDFPINSMVIFHSYVKLPEVCSKKRNILKYLEISWNHPCAVHEQSIVRYLNSTMEETQPFPGRDGSRLSPFGHGLSFIFGEPEANLVTKTHIARWEKYGKSCNFRWFATIESMTVAFKRFSIGFLTWVKSAVLPCSAKFLI